jgi:hypothetical protein
MTKALYFRPVAAYAIIALTLSVVAGSFAWVAGWIYWPFAPPPLTAARMIDVFESTTRKHPGFRRNHAKGLCVSGHFDSNGEGAHLSRASVFKRGSLDSVNYDGRPCCLRKECYPMGYCRFSLFCLFLFAGRVAPGPRRLSGFPQIRLQPACQHACASCPEPFLSLARRAML